MQICIQCGNQMKPGDRFCNRCGSPAQSASPVQNGQNVSGNHINETFSVIGGKRFTFTDTAIIYANIEYPYNTLSKISQKTQPTQFTYGTAYVTSNQQTLFLMYDFASKDRFNHIVALVNNRIDQAHGNSGYRYIIQFPRGKAEVYDEFVVISNISSGFMGTLTAARNNYGGVSNETKIFYSDISSVNIKEPDNYNMGQLQIVCSGGAVAVIDVTSANASLAREIKHFIEEQKKLTHEEPVVTDNEEWNPITGEQRVFNLQGKTLTITPDIDSANQYRLKFRGLAIKLSDAFQTEYKKRITNFDEFIQLFPSIYDKYLNIAVQKAIDLVVAESIWSVTNDSFISEHKRNRHFALDDYNTMCQALNNTIAANQNRSAGIASYIPTLSGGGFGLKGALKGIASATAFNVVRDGMVSSAVNSTSINAAQKTELYNRISPKNLFYRVFADYFNVFTTFCDVLKKNGKQIWIPTNEATQSAANIFQNLSNPNFPQDKVADTIISLLLANPYKAEYYKFMSERFGETDEVKAIREYFGFTDLNDNRIC